MIRRLKGVVKEVGENFVVLDVRGVGYLVSTPTASSNYVLEQDLEFLTHLAVRENALDLYGFKDRDEIAMFELLLDIPKVGPKSALQIMTLSTPQLIAEAAGKNDPVYLHKLSGIGKKTCEKIIDHLSKKLDSLPESDASENKDTQLNQNQTDAIDALMALGYDISSAREAVARIPDKHDSVNSIVTQALKQIP